MGLGEMVQDDHTLKRWWLLHRLRSEPVNSQDASLATPHGRKGWLKYLPTQLMQWAMYASGKVNGRLWNSEQRLSLPFTEDADVLLIVPPFASIWYPSLAAHVLQACARRAGFRVDVLYANMQLASYIGEHAYEQIAAESIALAGERFFARCAFGLPPLGHGAEQMFDPMRIFGAERGELYQGLSPDGERATLGGVKSVSCDEIKRWESCAADWVHIVAAEIVSRNYKIVGSTTTFQQTNASIALLDRVKVLDPSIVTVLGGANCEGEMADGLLALDTKVDYIFSGESEGTFPKFVGDILTGDPPTTRIVRGSPCQDMDALPFLSSTAYFQQRSRYLPTSAPARATYLTYETSRGCWWGQKQHCTFCGLNGEGMGFRRKSPDRVIAELGSLLAESPTKNISMTDNIMPHEFFKTLLPRLHAELPGVNIFYEQKSNLTFDTIVVLKEAGISVIQPGIEALSTRLLKRMRKGVTARQNLMLLRYGRIVGVGLVWNLICGFPNDERASYAETLALIPLIHHLQPPSGLWHLSIDRFSPYFFESSAFGVTNVRPQPVYKDFLPENADVAKIAYHFLGDYPCDTHQHIDLIRDLNVEVQSWSRSWQQAYQKRPELKVCCHNSHYLLVDTRGLPGTDQLRQLDSAEATLLLTAQPYQQSQAEDQAIDRKLAVVIDSWFVPLPIARQELFQELTTER